MTGDRSGPFLVEIRPFRASQQVFAVGGELLPTETAGNGLSRGVDFETDIEGPR